MSKKESSRAVVLQLMQDGVERTDFEIEKLTGLPHGKASGARSTLWEQGMVEPLPKENKREHTRWRLCPPERQAEVRQSYRDMAERRTIGRLMGKSPGERANIAVHLLADDQVNKALHDQLERSRAWRRARARARDIGRDRDAERRARRAELRQAMDNADTNLHFRQKVSQLRDLQDVLFVIGREVENEHARQLRGETSGIKPDGWRDVARNVREVLEVGQGLFRDLSELMQEPMESCPLCGERLHASAAHLDEGYIDAEVIEEADVETT
ncbi:MAG TPA: hypothetical protein VF009_07685 [Solirubrobacterales bacterium]